MGGRINSQRGLTLLELLVVMVILALASSVVMVNAPPARGAAKDEAERFAARLVAARQTAIVTGGAIRLRIEERGYAFERYSEDEWRDIEGDRLLKPRLLPPAVAMEAELDDGVNADPPRAGAVEDETRWAIIDPVGGADQCAIVFYGGRESWRVSMAPDGEVELRRNGAT